MARKLIVEKENHFIINSTYTYTIDKRIIKKSVQPVHIRIRGDRFSRIIEQVDGKLSRN